MRLQGRAAIVTGAASGIGRASAQLFAEEGALVLAIDLPGKKLAEAHEGTRVACFEKNIADADAPEAIVSEAIKKFGRLDILMNNAGVGSNALAEAMSDADWDRTLSVNLTAQFRIAQKAIRI